MKKKKGPIIKIRKRWLINPKTRVEKSNKIYRRTKKKSELRKLLRENK